MSRTHKISTTQTRKHSIWQKSTFRILLKCSIVLTIWLIFKTGSSMSWTRQTHRHTLDLTLEIGFLIISRMVILTTSPSLLFWTKQTNLIGFKISIAPPSGTFQSKITRLISLIIRNLRLQPILPPRMKLLIFLNQSHKLPHSNKIAPNLLKEISLLLTTPCYLTG